MAKNKKNIPKKKSSQAKASLKKKLKSKRVVLKQAKVAKNIIGKTKKKSVNTKAAQDKQSKVRFLGKTAGHRFQLANGLKIIFIPSKVAPVFSYQTWYNVGSRDEEKGYSGIAHLFEHMMFKETKNLKLGTFDKTMESNGARDLNAFTSTDYTAYVQSLPIKAFDLVASLESERMQNLSLTKGQFESEREVVHNERKQRTENNPDGVMFEELQKLAFPNHPYGRPVIGWEEDLNRMTTVDCEKFYRSYYSPNNAVIVVVGNLKPDFVLKTIKKYYGNIAAAEIQRPEVQAEKNQDHELRKELRVPIQVEKAILAYKIPSATHRDQIPLSIIGALLSNGRSSRLYRALVDSGITIDVGAGPGPGKDEGLFYISFSAQTGKKAAEAIAKIDSELDQLLREGLDKQELARAKINYKRNFIWV